MEIEAAITSAFRRERFIDNFDSIQEVKEVCLKVGEDDFIAELYKDKELIGCVLNASRSKNEYDIWDGLTTKKLAKNILKKLGEKEVIILCRKVTNFQAYFDVIKNGRKRIPSFESYLHNPWGFPNKFEMIARDAVKNKNPITVCSIAIREMMLNNKPPLEQTGLQIRFEELAKKFKEIDLGIAFLIDAAFSEEKVKICDYINPVGEKVELTTQSIARNILSNNISFRERIEFCKKLV